MAKNKKENLVELLNEIKDNEMALSLLFVSLISSDTLLSSKDCEKSIEYIKEMKEALPKSELTEEKKNKYLDFCNQGLEICERDLKTFKEQEENE